MEELKPCPFCGGEADIGENFDGQWGVFCETCRAVVWGYTKKASIAAWNRRAGEEDGRWKD